MKNYNITIKAVTFLLLISLFSCKPKEQGLDSKVRNLIESSSFSLLYSKYSSPFIIDRIVYDTIGTGDWSYNIAELMINNPQAFSDKTLFNELLDARQQIDTNDHNIRLIANIYGHYENNVDNFWNDNIFYIGIIGDSLTDVEKKPINALLNICSDEESNIIDVSNVIGLSDRRISSCMNKTIKKALSEKSYYGYDDKFSNKMKHSKIHSIFDDKGKVKDTIVHLQFMGICLNESIDSVILKHPNYSIVKDYSFNNYSCYH